MSKKDDGKDTLWVPKLSPKAPKSAQSGPKGDPNGLLKDFSNTPPEAAPGLPQGTRRLPKGTPKVSQMMEKSSKVYPRKLPKGTPKAPKVETRGAHGLKSAPQRPPEGPRGRARWAMAPPATLKSQIPKHVLALLVVKKCLGILSCQQIAFAFLVVQNMPWRS